jgi:hypothetical protein
MDDYQAALQELARTTLAVLDLEAELAKIDTFDPAHRALRHRVSAAEQERLRTARALRGLRDQDIQDAHDMAPPAAS